MKKKIPIVIATIRPWNIIRARQWTPPAGYKKIIITRKEQLTLESLKKINPRYVFFPHWSWIISADIYENFECIVFHMTDLPFGRGGSPLQNLIARGIYKSKVSALRVENGLDTGPIYLKRSFKLDIGSAKEIFDRVSVLSFSMMTDIVRRNKKPRPQQGNPVLFERRRPDQSRLPEKMTTRQAYDFIRMLDAPEYPAAFVKLGQFRIEFCNARFKGDQVAADAVIKKVE